MDLHEKTLNEKIMYEGSYLTFTNVEVQLPNGKIANRDIIKHPGACAIIPFIDEDTVLLIEQFRKPLDKIILEIPAGKLEGNEDHYLCAKRELTEETGYVAETLEYLGSIATAPGFCDEIIHLYKASNLILKEKNCDEDEFTIVKKFTLSTVKEMIKNGEIIDTKTISIMAYL